MLGLGKMFLMTSQDAGYFKFHINHESDVKKRTAYLAHSATMTH